MYFVKTPAFLQFLFSGAHWRFDQSDHIYLTFDDGPHPDSTPGLLSTLKNHNIKSTFFCSGRNVAQYPDLYNSIKDDGHAVGGHGYKHLSGWKTDIEAYLDNVLKGQATVDSKLFRPPYGKMTWRQYVKLKTMLDLIMWDVMPGDFDPTISADDLYKRILAHARKGSIVVLHDRPDTISRLNVLIPKLAEYYLHFGSITRDVLRSYT